MKKSNAVELFESELNQLSGGKVNPNATPDDPFDLDDIINDEGYEKFTDWLVTVIQPAKERTRAVNNDVNIMDFSI